ncbi:MAG: hypothetical protein J7M38_06830 [Armatimonadetes bacterium]|nr:hypothetical protein [Armatimonadota bacterium]
MKSMVTATAIICLLCLSPRIAPAADVSVAEGLTREFTVRPGEVVEGDLVIRNKGSRPHTVWVHKTDYLFRADGTTLYSEPGTLERSNADWISFGPSHLVIPPGESARVHYRIQVPDDTALTGTYWSMLMVEPGAEITAIGAEQGDNDKTTGVIRTILRYGVQMVTNIGADDDAQLKFHARRLAAVPDSYTLTLDIENTGRVWLSPTVWADLYAGDGTHVGRFDGEQMRLYPGCSGRFTIHFPSLKGGAYKALVVADNGDVNVFGARYEFKVD